MAKIEFEERLAVSLVKNHLQHLELDFTAIKKIVTQKVFKNLNHTRVIAVIGAGASSPLGLPLADPAKEEIIKASSMPKEMREAELERLTTVYRLPKDTFETTLMALCSNPYTAGETKERLRDLYGFRYIPSLCNEILAHLLKHRFIDAIINFNFDELLDQSIEDELDKEEYTFVLSDGDCPTSLSLINPILKKPLYIKPHGTVSHPSTLRFTHEDYFSLPSGISNLIKDLINTEIPLVLMVVGFGMQSFEFNKILEKAPKGSIIYSLNPKALPLSKELGEKFAISHIKVSRNNGLNKTMENLYENISELFEEGFFPRTIIRHKIVSRLFETNMDGEKGAYEKQLPEYFLHRAIIEICLEASKCKGVINIGESSRERSGRYYDKYVTRVKKKDRMTFYQICKSIGFHDVGYSKEILRLEDLGEKDAKPDLEWREFRYAVGQLFDKVSKQVPAVKKRFKWNILYKEFKDPLEDLFLGEGAEIKILPEPLQTKIFKNPKSIQTRTEFNYITYKIISDPNCMYIWSITETGVWLQNPRIKNCIKKDKEDNFRITLILGDPPKARTFTDDISSKIEEIREIPWWEHNRHMTITLDLEEKPIASIYFTRRYKNSQITPVLLDKHDTKLILDMWKSYKKMSQLKYPSNSEDGETNKKKET